MSPTTDEMAHAQVVSLAAGAGFLLGMLLVIVIVLVGGMVWSHENCVDVSSLTTLIGWPNGVACRLP